ncbi:hypothetical protein GCM10027275_14720 [Rhabdobacter roseus]|uniref:Putative RNase H-like HicB family nuclease n=1 Tax=Rhabdobacter roseus TaxID=1655419 RepID=A0A840TPA6_9BACT|nr:type II toxin-antitoxin system HicB family antitoxin [Rhabdobacter roseus]MBB5283392.1 putative RNase H-like HicB family nuclease [Rhabdobacter roseus]
MEKSLVIISHTGKNYNAYLPELPGCISTGATFEAIKDNIAEAVALHVEGSLADGDPIPDTFKRDYELEFKLDVSALLHELKDIIPYSGVARLTGINRKQLQHYASGLKQPRPAQVKKIETALHELGQKLLGVEL